MFTVGRQKHDSLSDKLHGGLTAGSAGVEVFDPRKDTEATQDEQLLPTELL